MITLAGVELPNPEIGNSRTLIHRVFTHLAMDGNYYSYKMGASTFQLLMRFQLRADKYSTLMSALKSARGSKLTLTDNRGKTFTGIILNNPFEAASTLVNNPQISYDVTIQFEGK
jgi:hypothetical protein